MADALGDLRRSSRSFPRLHHASWPQRPLLSHDGPPQATTSVSDVPQVCNDLQLEEIELLSKPGGPLHGSGGHHSRCSPTIAGCPNQRYTTNRQHVSSASEEVKQQEQVQGNNRSIRSLPTPTHPWSGTLQLWAAVAAARPGGPGLLGARPGLPQPHLAPQQAFFAHGRSIEFLSLSTNYYSF
jgi:hypothetical protein